MSDVLAGKVPAQGVNAPPPAVRTKLPDLRKAITHKFAIAGYDGYVTVGMYDDGRPGEIFLMMAREGSTICGLMDAFAMSFSLALQHGVPLEELVEKFANMRFEPAGFTKNPEIPYAKSIIDYVVRWLGSRFLVPASVPNAPGPSASETCDDCHQPLERMGGVLFCRMCGNRER